MLILLSIHWDVSNGFRSNELNTIVDCYILNIWHQHKYTTKAKYLKQFLVLKFFFFPIDSELKRIFYYGIISWKIRCLYSKLNSENVSEFEIDSMVFSLENILNWIEKGFCIQYIRNMARGREFCSSMVLFYFFI